MKAWHLVLASLVLVAVLGPVTAWAEVPLTAVPAATAAAPAATGTATAAPAAKLDSGDTAWLLASAALVLIMTPGLAFFYGGMVRKKNVLGILMQCTIIMCLISVQWVLFGYSIAFGPGNPFFGYLDWACLSHVTGELAPAAYGATVPHQAYMIFQAMFAIITPALIIGAFAERMKFSAFLAFILLWATFVYDPIAHWVWGDGGWLNGGTFKASRLRRWNGRAYQRRRRGPRGLPPDGPPQGLRQADQPAAQRPVHRAWGRRSSGSAGSGSTPAARWQPTGWRPTRSW